MRCFKMVLKYILLRPFQVSLASNWLYIECFSLNELVLEKLYANKIRLKNFKMPNIDVLPNAHLLPKQYAWSKKGN